MERSPPSNESPFVNQRKRKQPEDDKLSSIASFQQKLEKQLDLWKGQLDTTITETIKKSMHTIVEQEIEKISTSMKDVFKEFSARLDSFDNSLVYIMERQDSFDSRLKEIEGKFQGNCDVSDQISALQNKIDIMEQQARSYNIEIANLPERRNENLLSIVEKIGCVIKHPVHTSDIVSVHRVPHFDNRNTRPKNIIARFTTKIIRNNFLVAARATKGLKSDQLSVSGTVQNVYINEHLTVKNKQLFRMSREQAAKNNFKYVWIKHGTVLVRQTDSSAIFAVRNKQDVKKIRA
ncbi:hypothetical protein ACJJTC_001072 [Scirpophaga incertulas]